MNRGIKFQVLITGNNKELIYKFHEWLEPDGWKHDFYTPLVSNGVFHFEELGDGWNGEIIRRQYTGLKDRSGTEIYEGDILYVDCSGVGGSFEDGQYTVLYFLPDCAFCLVSIDRDHAIRFNECYEYEIVGKKFSNMQN